MRVTWLLALAAAVACICTTANASQGYAYLSAPQFFSDTEPSQHYNRAGRFRGITTTLGADVVSNSVSFWIAASISQHTTGTQLLWSVGSREAGVSLVYKTGNVLTASFCSSGSVVAQLDYKFDVSQLTETTDIVVSLDQRGTAQQQQEALLAVNGSIQTASPSSFMEEWADDETVSHLQVVTLNLCGQADADLTDATVSNSNGLRIYLGWSFFSKPVTGAWHQYARPRISIGAAADQVYVASGDYLTINRASFNGKRDPTQQPLTIQMSMQFAPKLSGEPEAIFDFGGNVYGTLLAYAEPNTLILSLCQGRDTATAVAYQLPDYLVRGGSDAPFVDVLLVRGHGNSMSLVVDGIETPVTLAKPDIAGGDPTGILKVHSGACSDPNSYPEVKDSTPFVSGSMDWNIGVSLWVEEVHPLSSLPAGAVSSYCNGKGIVVTSHETGLARCSCRPGFGGTLCEADDDSTLAPSCYESEAALTTGAALLRPDPNGPPIALHCEMDVWGGGNTICGKFFRDNPRGKRFLDNNFGRETSPAKGLYDLTILSQFDATSYQASHDCRQLIDGKGAGVFMSAGSNAGLLPFDTVYFTSILDEVLQNATHLWDVSRRPEALGGEVACEEEAIDVFNVSGLSVNILPTLQLGQRAAVTGTGTMWVNVGGPGAVMSSSATKTCQGTKTDVAFWGFVDADGNSPSLNCGSPVGTSCGENNPAYTFNYLYVKATPPLIDMPQLTLGDPTHDTTLLGGFNFRPSSMIESSATLETVVNFLRTPPNVREAIFTLGSFFAGVSLIYDAPYTLRLAKCQGAQVTEVRRHISDIHLNAGQRSVLLSLDLDATMQTLVAQVFLDYAPLMEMTLSGVTRWSDAADGKFFVSNANACGGDLRAPRSMRVNPLKGLRVWSGSVFTNRDRCIDQSPCMNGGTCFNGYYDPPSCVCPPGFKGDFCQDDINECANPRLNNCHQYANCINFPSGFSCQCQNGFTGNGTYCVDILAPDLSCPSDIESPDAIIGWVTPTATDNLDTTVAVTCDKQSGRFDFGTTTVTCKATDSADNTGACSFTVTRIDTIKPQFVSCPSGRVVGTDPGTAQYTLNYTAPIAIDNAVENVQVTCDKAVGTKLPLGTTNVTCTADDTRQQSQCSFTITVQDVEPPTLTCPTAVEAVAAEGASFVDSVSFGAPAAVDNVDLLAVTVSCNATSGQGFGVGRHRVLCSSEDSRGNVGTCTFRVIIRDVTPPTLVCPSQLVFETDAGLPGADPSIVSRIQAEDNGRVAGTVCTHGDGTSLPIGATEVTCTVTDGFSNTASCTVSVTVNDKEPPSITCGDDVLTATDESVPTAVVAVGFPTVRDNSGQVATASCDLPPENTFSLGRTNVSCTAVDVAGNLASCLLVVEVEDRERPSLTCPTAVSRRTDPGRNTTLVVFEPEVTDNSQEPLLANCTRQSPILAGLGRQSIRCSATDVAGNSAVCGFDIAVFDPEPPVLSCPSSVRLVAEANATTARADWASAVSATDNSGERVFIQYSVEPGELLPLGVHDITCVATDTTGNVAECLFVAIVELPNAPAVACPNNIVTPSAPGSSQAQVSWSGESAVDIDGNALSVQCVPGHQMQFTIGRTYVFCSAVDAEDRVGHCTFTVTVRDEEPPTIRCPELSVLGTLPNLSVGRLSYTLPVGSDNSGAGVDVSCSPAPDSAVPLGSGEITCEAVDAAGNRATCSSAFAVEDQQRPNISCPSNRTVLTSRNLATGIVVLEEPLASDNVAVTSVECNVQSGLFALGEHDITCTVRDAARNSNACVYTVTVQDKEPPRLSCPSPFVVVTDMSPPNVTSLTLEVVEIEGSSSTTVPTRAGTAEQKTQATATAGTGGTTQKPTGMTGNNSTITTSATSSSAEAAASATSQPPMTTTIGLRGDPNIGTDFRERRARLQLQPVGIPFQVRALDSASDVSSLTCVPEIGVLDVGNVTTVVCRALDASGNEGMCSFQIAVQTPTAPRLHCDEPITVVVDQDSTAPVVFNSSALANDVDTGQDLVQASCSLPASGRLPVGIHAIACSGRLRVNESLASDVGFCFTMVTVDERNAPVILCPDNVGAVLSPAPLAGAARVTLLPPQASDDDQLLRVGCDHDPVTYFPFGEHTVSCAALDRSGNAASCSFQVTVADEDPPVLQCPSAVQASVSRLTESAKVVEIGTILAEDNSGATSTDNGSLSVVCNTPEDLRFPIAERTTVTCNSTDISGNKGYCSFEVEVGVDCIGQWSDWQCQACPGRMEWRTFEVSAFPVLGGAQCPEDEERACMDAEPCYRVTCDLQVGPVSNRQRALTVLREDLFVFLASAFERLLQELSVNTEAAFITVTGLREIARDVARRSLSDDAHARAVRQSEDFISVSLLVDAERSVSQLIEDALLAADDDNSTLPTPTAAAMLRDGDPEDIFDAVSVIALDSVVREPVLAVDSTSTQESDGPGSSTTPEGSTTATFSGSSAQTEVPLVVGASTAALVLVLVVVAVIVVRARNKDEPVVLARRVDAEGGQSFGRYDGSLRGVPAELRQAKRTNPLYDSTDDHDRSEYLDVRKLVDEADSVDGEDEAAGYISYDDTKESLYDVVVADVERDTQSDEYDSSFVEDSEVDAFEEDGSGDLEEDSVAGMFGFGDDPMLAGLMNGLMSSEKMISQRKLEMMEERNKHLQRQLSILSPGDSSSDAQASDPSTSTPVVDTDSRTAGVGVRVQRPPILKLAEMEETAEATSNPVASIGIAGENDFDEDPFMSHEDYDDCRL